MDPKGELRPSKKLFSGLEIDETRIAKTPEEQILVFDRRAELALHPDGHGRRVFVCLKKERGCHHELPGIALLQARVVEQDRLPVARRYIELTEKLRETEQRIKDLQLAGDLAIQWAGKAVSTYLANPHPAS